MGGLPVLPNVVTYQVGFWLCCLESENGVTFKPLKKY